MNWSWLFLHKAKCGHNPLATPIGSGYTKVDYKEMRWFSCISFRISFNILSSNFVYIITLNYLQYLESLKLAYVNTTIFLKAFRVLNYFRWTFHSNSS